MIQTSLSERNTLGDITMQTTYFKGDKAKYTGKITVALGVEWHEIEILEGHLKGETRVTGVGPKETILDFQKKNSAL